jgi:pimeloyl-ACP methyl ester carboxylesterase
MLVNIKQLDFKKYFIILFSSFLFLGCSNNIVHKVLYQPPKTNQELSTAYLYKYLDINTSDGVKLSVIKYISPLKAKGTVLFLHGNADNITQLPFALLNFVKEGYDLVFLDYRGYGKSTGSPSPKGLNLDIQATINYLSKKSSKNLYIYAQSIGGTSLLGALNQINKNNIKAIVTEGSFLSYKQLSDATGISIPFTDYKELELYAPISSDKNTTIPLMLIHSESDEIIPYSQGLALAKYFVNAKHIKITGNHLSYLRFSFNRKKIFNFFEKHKNYKYTQLMKTILNDKNSTKKISLDMNKTIETSSTILKEVKND